MRNRWGRRSWTASLVGAAMLLGPVAGRAEAPRTGYPIPVGTGRCNGALVTVNGRLTCMPAQRGYTGSSGSHAYERWDDGSPARNAKRAPGPESFPLSYGSYNLNYGFGR